MVFYLFSSSHPFEQQCVTSVDDMQLGVAYETSQVINTSCSNLFSLQLSSRDSYRKAWVTLGVWLTKLNVNLAPRQSVKTVLWNVSHVGKLQTSAVWKEHYAQKSTVRNNTWKQWRPAEIANKKPIETYVKLALTFWYATGNSNWERNVCVQSTTLFAQALWRYVDSSIVAKGILKMDLLSLCF